MSRDPAVNPERESTLSIRVVELSGPHCVSREMGEKIYDAIVPALEKGATLTIDFTNVLTLTSQFLNPAIGRLYGKFDKSFLAEHIKWSGIDDVDASIVRAVIENAEDYYRKNPAARTHQQDIVRNTVEEQ